MTRLQRTATIVAAVAFSLVTSSGCGGQTPRPDASREDEGTLRQVVHDSAAARMVSDNIPGVAIALVRGGNVAWIDGIGVTREGGAKIGADTVFEGASLGKPLFAYGVVKLARRGVIDLDAPLARYLPQRIQGAARDSGVTAARILSHTSGLDLKAGGAGLVLASPPGTRWRYSGAAYVVLQRAIENVSGKPLDQWMHEEVLDPLGMAHTSYLAVSGADSIHAVGHDRDGKALPPTPWAEANAASSLHTTAADYARFMAAAMKPENGAMWKPRLPVSPEHDLFGGLGWEVSDTTAPVILHWGSNPGFKSLAVGVPGKGDACVILTNGDNGLELADVIAPRLLGREIGALGFRMLHPTD